jgi:hypothetical protein
MIGISSELLNNTSVNMLLKKAPGKFEDVAIEASNKATVYARSETRKRTPKKWNVQKEELQDFKLTKASKKSGEIAALATLRGKRIPLIKMGANPKGVMTGKTTGGVSVLIRGARHQFRSAFVSNIGGRFQVYRRKGKDRFPVEALTTASIPQMVGSEKENIADDVINDAQKVFNDTFVSEAESWLRVMGGK